MQNSYGTGFCRKKIRSLSGLLFDLASTVGAGLCFSYWFFFYKSADVANRLPQALLVFHKSDAHIAFAVFAESPAGRNGDLCIFHQVHRVIDTALAS